MDKKKTPWYDNIEKFMLITESLACLTILAVNVFTRTFFSYTASWSEQAARLLFVWMSFTACSLCGMTGSHLQVTAVEMIPNKKVVEITFWIGDIIAVAFSFFLTSKLITVFKTVYTTHQMFTAIPWLPAWWLYLPGVLGMAGFGIRVIQKRFRQVRDGRKTIPDGNEKNEEVGA